MRCEDSDEYRLAHEVKNLADSVCAIVWGHIGDLDYFVKFFDFPIVNSTGFI